MQIEWTISLGSLITSGMTLLGFMVAALGFFYALRRSIDTTNERMLLLSGRMINVENELKELSRVLVQMAVQDQKIINVGQQLEQMRRSSDDWRSWVRSQLDDLRRVKG